MVLITDIKQFLNTVTPREKATLFIFGPGFIVTDAIFLFFLYITSGTERVNCRIA